MSQCVLSNELNNDARSQDKDYRTLQQHVVCSVYCSRDSVCPGDAADSSLNCV